MNFYVIAAIFFVKLNKIVVNEMGTAALDVCVVVSTTACLAALPVLVLSKDLSFIVPRENRKIFFSRAVLGWVHIVVYVIGGTLVPITIQQTLANTAPFWASIFAFCFIKESITRLEALAMVISFGAVALITFS